MVWLCPGEERLVGRLVANATLTLSNCWQLLPGSDPTVPSRPCLYIPTKHKGELSSGGVFDVVRGF